MDQPRTLRDKTEIERRRTLLDQPHMAELRDFARKLRNRSFGSIPDFDPLDGGENAQALFLLEKPGPRAFLSGFISRNNNDCTAEATFRFMEQANVPRNTTLLWNVMPGWDGARKYVIGDLKIGSDVLPELLEMLPKLKVIVCVGEAARKAFSHIKIDTFPVLTSLHPSPINRASRFGEWSMIPIHWAKVLTFMELP